MDNNVQACWSMETLIADIKLFIFWKFSRIFINYYHKKIIIIPI